MSDIIKTDEDSGKLNFDLLDNNKSNIDAEDLILMGLASKESKTEKSVDEEKTRKRVHTEKLEE